MLNTKDVKTGGGGGTPKSLKPGNHTVTINHVTLEDYKFKPGALHIVLHVEGPAIEDENFQGWQIDRDDPSKGYHAGQTGRVKVSDFAFSDGFTKGGREIKRDAEILRFLKSLCVELDCVEWFEGEDGKHATVHSLIEAFSNDKPFKNKELNVCIAGNEYTNKGGYTDYYLFFPKFSRAGVPFESVTKSPSKILQFDPKEHIKKKEEEKVQSFGNEPSGKGPITNSDFKL